MRRITSSLQWSVAVAIILLLMPSAGFASPSTHALLIGVSEYPSLGARYQLRGPANDVQLYRQLLRARGVPEQNILVLADRVAGAALPTRSAILQGLQSLATRVAADDLVFLFIAGHGSQQPAARAADEADGLDEIFLPRDIGRWQRADANVRNAITDDELGVALRRLRARGAFVWAIFDTCHAGTLARAVTVPEQTDRQVRPEELGIEADMLANARAGASEQRSRGTVLEDAPSDEPTAGDKYVYMYASQSYEVTPELRLPPYALGARTRGLFAHTLYQVLSTAPTISYRQAVERVQQIYWGQGRSAPSPLYEGTALDSPVFGNSLPMRQAQWPVTRRGESLRLSAGQLEGIGTGSIFGLVGSPDATEMLGYASVQSATLGSAVLVPTQHRGVATSWAKLPQQGLYARPVEVRIDFKLRVGQPQTGSDCELTSVELRQAITVLARDASISRRIQWPSSGVADVYLCQKADRLLFLDDSAPAVVSTRGLPGISLPTPGTRTPAWLAEQLHGQLQRVARVTNIARVLAENQQLAQLDITLSWWRPCKPATRCDATPQRLEPASRPQFQGGERVLIELVNPGFQPIDVTVLYIDGAYGIQALYPKSGDAPRLDPKGKQRIDDIEISADPSGFERLLILAAPVAPLAEVTSFATLAQAGMPTTQRSATNSLLELLHDAAFGASSNIGAQTRSVQRHSGGTTVGVTTYAWTVARPEDSNGR